jgi:purine catabolism regulator
MPELGMTMERVVAPIVAGREIYGYIWIVAGDHPLTELDEMAIDDAATVGALVLLKEQAVREAQLAVRGDFLTHLLRTDVEQDSFSLERAHLVGYQFDQPHQVLFVIGKSLAGGTVQQLSGRLDNWLRSLGQWGLVVVRERGIAMILESKSNTTGQEIATRLLQEINHPVQPLAVGVGQVCLAGKPLSRSFEEALEAADIAWRLGGEPRVACFWELGLLDWVYHLPHEVLTSNGYLAKLHKLADHDSRTNGDMVRTLEAYLEYGGALAEAAAVLNIHRNTLLYRLGRVEEITDLDLKDVEQRLNVHVALKAYQLKM